MGAMTDWYKKYQMGIVDEDTFDLEEEYNMYINEEHPIARIAYSGKKALNALTIRDPKKREIANRADAAKIGEMSSRMSYNRELLGGDDGIIKPKVIVKFAHKNDRLMSAKERYKEKVKEEPKSKSSVLKPAYI